MPRDKQPNLQPDILDNLFGDPEDMADEDLDNLYDALAPGTDPSAIVRKVAEQAAVQHRLKNKVPPDHIQAALAGTREVKSIDDMPPSALRQIVDAIKLPFTGSVSDAQFAYRNRQGELDDHDQGLIEELTEEVQEDWGEESEEKE